jgi:sulfite exporter TauE/SafE
MAMMIDATALASAGAGLLAGALSGLHCGAMCGGIVSAHSSLAAATNPRLPMSMPIRLVAAAALPLPARPLAALPSSALTRNLAFNCGRILSYTVAGALAGSLGGASLVMQDSMPLREFLFVAANLMLIALGLYVAGWWRGVTVLERIGTLLWRRLQPLAAGLLRAPDSGFRHSLALGAVWGWIPCGLVYAMLVTAMASGNAANGAVILLAFGLGTLPNLLLLGWASGRLAAALRQPTLRRIAGLGIIAFGVFGLWRLPELAKLGGWGALCQPLLGQIRHVSG